MFINGIMVDFVRILKFLTSFFFQVGWVALRRHNFWEAKGKEDQSDLTLSFLVMLVSLAFQMLAKARY